MKTYAITYRMDGFEYAESIKAESFEDADKRIKAIRQTGLVEGEIHASVPVPTFFARLFGRKEG